MLMAGSALGMVPPCALVWLVPLRLVSGFDSRDPPPLASAWLALKRLVLIGVIRDDHRFRPGSSSRFGFVSSSAVCCPMGDTA
jgi:hypothetical protein